LSTVRHTIKSYTDLNKKLIIRAPITGIVKGLTASAGSVISAGQNVLEIVPSRGEMIIQCKISTKDIGHVKIGDPAQVKVMAYEFTRYGMVNGKVIEISASTFTTDKGLPYYLGKVSLEKNYVGDEPEHNILKPGMTVQVDIITGKKSVMSYLLNPITRGLKQSFREP
jgi:HlyD family secretion protein/adhesin transport system membrane fusion protein